MTDAESEVPRPVVVREAWIAALGVLLLLGVVKHLGAAIPFIGRHAFTLAAGAQLYVPIFLIGRRGITKASLGLTFARVREDLTAVAVLGLLTAIPYAVGHHFWQTMVFHHAFRFRIPEDFLLDVVTQVLVVALAEEVYFRGYLQERIDRVVPPARLRIFGVPFGRAVILTSVVFALAHFVGEYRFDRLGPFFPGLVFGLLRARTGTVIGAVGYHAFCNILSDVLWTSYRP